MDLDSIKQSLTRKIGPLPAYAWLGIVGVAIYWYRKKHDTTTTAATDTTSNDEADNYADGYGTGYQAGVAADAPSTTGTGSGGGGNGSGGGTGSTDPGTSGLGALPDPAQTTPATTTPGTTSVGIPASLTKAINNINTNLGKLTKAKAGSTGSNKAAKPPTAAVTRARNVSAINSAGNRARRLQQEARPVTKSRTVKAKGGTTVRNRPKTKATTVAVRTHVATPTTRAVVNNKPPAKPTPKAPARKVTKKR